MTDTTEINDTGLLPKRPRGRPSRTFSMDAHQARIKRFCDLILQIHSTMDFRVGSRGWCYILERHGLLKGDFKDAEKLITEFRKSGDLPLDICAEDDSRGTIGLEQLDSNDIPQQVDSWVEHLRNHAHEQYTPDSFWDDLPVYIEAATEKLDLRNLFEPVCRELHVPITNFKGWSDVNSRAAMMRRFKYHEEAGRQCILLLCGDHDPGGLHITDMMESNFEDLSKAWSEAEGPIDWTPKNLVVDRFGLNADFIDRNNLTWIDNLETSSGGRLDDPHHADHNKEYVQSYIAQFGVRKCEANALVVEPVVGRQLMRDAIMQYLPADAVANYNRKLERIRRTLREALWAALNLWCL